MKFYSVEECRKLLQAYKVRNINASTVAKVLTMMAMTTTSNLDSVPLLQVRESILRKRKHHKKTFEKT